jgi:hypothetical protein
MCYVPACVCVCVCVCHKGIRRYGWSSHTIFSPENFRDISIFILFSTSVSLPCRLHGVAGQLYIFLLIVIRHHTGKSLWIVNSFINLPRVSANTLRWKIYYIGFSPVHISVWIEINNLHLHVAIINTVFYVWSQKPRKGPYIPSWERKENEWK